VLSLLVAVADLASCTSAPHQPAARTGRRSGPPASAVNPRWSGGPGQPADFVALRYAPTGASKRQMARFPEVAVSDSRTGAIVRRLLPGSRDGMAVVGVALDRSGNLWVTYSRGPASRGDVAGGDPKPHSCANEIMVAHGISGRLRTFLRTSNSVLISGAQTSPDGRLLAFRESGCANGYFNNYLRVMRLASRHSWTIGAGLPRCHWITDPSWSADGRSLLVGYAPAAIAHYTGPQGSCQQPRTEGLAEVTATAAQAGLAGATASPAHGCQITSAAGVAGGGAVVIEACGRREARLLVLTPRLRTARQFPLGRCTDGNELNPDLSGRHVLVSAYLFCNPPGRPGPLTRLWSYSARGLRPVISVRGGTLSVAYMAW
jgi:hypothetical protein